MHYFQQILNDLNIRYTVPYAQHLFESRSDANSLYGIKKMLETFGLSITAIMVEDADEIKYPVVCIYKGQIKVLQNTPAEKQELVGKPMLLITDRGAAREPDYFEHLIQVILGYAMPYIAAVAALFLVVAAFITKPVSDANTDFWHKVVLVFLNGLGAFFSWRTVAKECSGSCHEVLESAASKLFGIYSLGVIGLTYFIGSFLIALCIPSLAPTATLISCAALIMPVWSISYQAFVVRSWCRNCLGVQAVLVLTFAAELFFHRVDIHQLRWIESFEAIALYVLIFFISDRVYNIVQREKNYPRELIPGYLEMMKDKNTRDALINNGKVHNTTGASNIVIQNPDSTQELFFVISPFCAHCKKLFTNLREMITTEKLHEYRVVLLFPPEPAALPVSGSIIAEYRLHGSEAAMNMLSKWYQSHSIRKFRKIYSTYPESTENQTEMTHQKEWYDLQDFHGTPVLLVNSHVLSPLLLEGITIQPL